MFHPQRQHSMVISPCWPQGAHGETYACARSPTFTGAHTHTLWLITEQTLHALRWINVKWAALRPLSKTGKNIPSHPQTVSPSAPSCVFLRKHHAAVSSELAGILPGTLMLPMHETARPPLLPITDPRYSAHSHGELGGDGEAPRWVSKANMSPRPPSPRDLHHFLFLLFVFFYLLGTVTSICTDSGARDPCINHIWSGRQSKSVRACYLSAWQG